MKVLRLAPIGLACLAYATPPAASDGGISPLGRAVPSDPEPQIFINLSTEEFLQKRKELRESQTTGLQRRHLYGLEVANGHFEQARMETLHEICCRKIGESGYHAYGASCLRNLMNLSCGRPEGPLRDRKATEMCPQGQVCREFQSWNFRNNRATFTHCVEKINVKHRQFNDPNGVKYIGEYQLSGMKLEDLMVAMEEHAVADFDFSGSSSSAGQQHKHNAHSWACFGCRYGTLKITHWNSPAVAFASTAFVDF
ncbi:hypothetical protein UVI_02027100 [Ustilaginoidea virens]|uniref:Secreted in xylem 1 protein n=1 Tax=Ustilaginoidea virens TaxID=1159556 RepID=A0A1B5L457_USTVR|nr:hypothetical protein UVI_02027100 [Ustilaginoidea virens]